MNIPRLQDAIRQLHHCESRYLESVTVSGSFLFFQKSAVSKGEVAIFEICGHPHAKRAYAWSSPAGNSTRSVVVLEIPPVSSPQTAFEAAMAAQIIDKTSR